MIENRRQSTVALPDSEDCELLLDAVTGAAEIAVAHFGKSVSVWRKSGNEPVCDGDIAVNRHLQATIAAARSEDGWLSEENREGHSDTASCARPRRVWIVDPIDGTRSFLRGQDDFAVSVALAIDGRPVLGAIAQPMTGDLYLARRGGGATLNGTPMRVRPRDRLEGCRMAADEDFFRARRHWPFAWPEMAYSRIGSIALRVAYVAAGRLDAAVSLKPKAHWDLAAAHLILEEAGGKCVNERGDPLDYAGRPPLQPCFAAASPALIAPILARLEPAMRRRRAQATGNSENE